MRNRIAATAILGMLLAGLAGCGYVLTFDEAFPQEPVNFPRWDPPDSVALAAWAPDPTPPPVEAVILDSYFYYLIHPPGEADSLAARAQRERARSRPASRPTPKPPVEAAPPDTSLAQAADTTATESTRTDTVAAVEPLPPVQVDLSRREEDVLRRRAQVDMERAESILVILDARKNTSASFRDQTSLVRSYLGQTRGALDRRDFQGAANLALKARILAESLDEAKP